MTKELDPSVRGDDKEEGSPYPTGMTKELHKKGGYKAAFFTELTKSTQIKDQTYTLNQS
jgi:hypothetical protein